MNKFFYTLMGGLLMATVLISTDAESATGLARKTGGAPARLQDKQQKRHKAARNQPEMQLARKVGGYRTRLLHRQRAQYRRSEQA